jgi:pyrimidine-specific ribonucleoside hydrolase
MIACIIALALVPSSLAATQADWQFNEVVRTMSGVSYETLTAVVAGVRLAIGGLMLATVAILLSRAMQPGALLAALALVTFPFTAGLFGNAGSSTYPAPWSELLGAVVTVLSITGGLAMLALLFLFPDGRFYSPRMRVLSLVALLLMVVGIAITYLAENGWWVFILTLLGVTVLGVGGQALRYRAADSVQRYQTAGFMATILLVPLWVLTGVVGFSPLVSLVTSYILLAMIPLGLYLAAWRGLWGNRASQKVYVGAVVLPALAAIFVAGIWWQGSQAATIDLSALDASNPIPVVLDADMAMDDIGALFYLARHPGIDLRAITVNGVAFAHCDGGVRNALGLLEVAGAPEIPVSCGREEAYPGGTPAPDDWRKSADNLYGAQVRTGGRVADGRPAAELLADTIRTTPGEIVVVAIGPLTNLAEAFQADPTLAGQIKEIIIMGGAMDAPGNVADGDPTNQVAEWNIIADPMAADIVMASGAPITLVPLDATNDVPFTRGFYERLRADALTRPAVFTYNLMYMNQWWLDGGMYWWDTLAAAVVTDPDLVTMEQMALDVVTDGGAEMGRTIEAPGGSPARVAVAADRQRFEALFLAVLNYE